jgi:hypothetical protein
MIREDTAPLLPAQRSFPCICHLQGQPLHSGVTCHYYSSLHGIYILHPLLSTCIGSHLPQTMSDQWPHGLYHLSPGPSHVFFLHLLPSAHPVTASPSLESCLALQGTDTCRPALHTHFTPHSVSTTEHQGCSFILWSESRLSFASHLAPTRHTFLDQHTVNEDPLSSWLTYYTFNFPCLKDSIKTQGHGTELSRQRPLPHG